MSLGFDARPAADAGTGTARAGVVDGAGSAGAGVVDGAGSVGAASDQRVIVEGDTVVSTPGLRRIGRRASFWVGLAVALVVLALVTIAIAGAGESGPQLSGTSAAANGSKALMQVLRSNGVAVTTPRSLGTAISDATKAGGTNATFAIYDPNDLLNPGQLARLRGVAGTLVLVNPSFGMLRELAPDVRLAGVGKSSFSADTSTACGFAPLKQAGRVSGESTGFRIVGSPSETVQKCLPNGSDSYSLVTVTTGSSRVIVFGLPDALTNEFIVNDGNAAFALGTFGHERSLTWYLPSQADVTLSAADRPVPLPGWVLPTELLAVMVVIAAAIWRGRRFGPLVIERMPVVVRASETMEGRARLYQRASARQHALDALRIGSVGRLATLCGLPALSTIDEIIGAVAAVTGDDPREVRALLVDDVPANDSQLVKFSDRLEQLEESVARATRPQ